ncbi:MAG: hypothetical protein P8L32_00165 [Paracoccaceae bacterium]|jgi:hypothetical protein|nr:hypothetical protein [Paracoccaceae bacterium]
MSFLRPEARQSLHRYRDLIIAGLVGSVGLYWALSMFGLMVWIGWLLVIVALAFAASGIQRLRFRSEQGGVGIVSVHEGQITYLSPFDGGMVALSEINTLILDYAQDPARWVLMQPGQADVQIPLNAEGTDKLFDIFAALPGLQTEAMLAALQKNDGHPIVIWQRSKSQENVKRLH